MSVRGCVSCVSFFRGFTPNRSVDSSVECSQPHVCQPLHFAPLLKNASTVNQQRFRKYDGSSVFRFALCRCVHGAPPSCTNNAMALLRGLSTPRTHQKKMRKPAKIKISLDATEMFLSWILLTFSMRLSTFISHDSRMPLGRPWPYTPFYNSSWSNLAFHANF